LFRDSFNVELNATLPYAIIREFREQRAKITERIRRMTEQYMETEIPNQPEMIEWVKHHSEYRIAMDYLKYAFKVYGFNQFSPDLREGFPQSYFDFWEAFPLNNPAAHHSLNYQNYLQLYRKYLMANLRQTTVYQDCLKFPNCNPFELQLDQLTANLKGTTKDWLLSQQVDYQLLRNNQQFLDEGFDLFLQEIEDSIIIKDLRARRAFLYDERSFNLNDEVQLIQTTGTGTEVLQTIAKNSTNETILLYFWNTQRPISYPYDNKERRLATWKKLDSLGLDLVMLAHHSTPNIWKEKIGALELKGRQWHLTDEQFAYFEDFFQNNRIPHQTYDRILDRENFMLLSNQQGQLNTLESIQLRERSFAYLSGLNWLILNAQAEQRRKQIKVDG
ncbi:MAG: hypothetical protein AAGJ18_29445, partial [Bacteroidota bacterium]